MMLVEGAALEAADVVEAEQLLGQFVVVGQTDAALAAGQSLAHLQGEAADVADRAAAPISPD